MNRYLTRGARGGLLMFPHRRGPRSTLDAPETPAAPPAMCDSALTGFSQYSEAGRQCMGGTDLVYAAVGVFIHAGHFLLSSPLTQHL